MSGLPTITLSSGFPRTAARRQLLRLPTPTSAAHPKELPPVRASAPNTGNPKLDQKYQQQQQSVIAKQNQQRQQLQQKQDQEHQQLTRQNAPPARTQQVEQRHQQQTQQLHTQADYSRCSTCSRGSSQPVAEDLVAGGGGNRSSIPGLALRRLETETSRGHSPQK